MLYKQLQDREDKGEGRDPEASDAKEEGKEGDGEGGS